MDKFVKDHKTGIIVAAGVAVVAGVAAAVAWGRRKDGDDGRHPPSTCSAPQAAARFTTGAEGYGYGDANDIDGETSLIAGFDMSNKDVKIGAYHTTWSANRKNMLLVVNAPNTEDGRPPGIKAEARSIVVPLDGWEDSDLKDLCVASDQQIDTKLPGGENMCVEVMSDVRSGVHNVVIFPSGASNVYFPVGFVIPAMNLRLAAREVV